jgi:RNA ligase
MKHPARSLTFDELWTGLKAAKDAGHVNENISAGGLSLFCYTTSCVYEGHWNEMTILARGIILDPSCKKLVATPFPKFFNVGERGEPIPDLAFEVYEKLDGSLIIIFHHDGQWRCATKGSFSSVQAKWASDWIANFDLSLLSPGTTYLAEAIYPENRIVIHYTQKGLFLLAAYLEDGSEMSYDELKRLGAGLNWSVVKRHNFDAISQLLIFAKDLPRSEEGFVLHFSDGKRLKIKGEEYCRIHRMVSHLTPLAMWEVMMAGDDLEDVRRQLPEEFWIDFDAIIAVLQRQLGDLLATIKVQAEAVAHLSDKDVGLLLASIPEPARRFIFPFRRSGGNLLASRMRDTVFRIIRPTGNVLVGYAPSYAVSRVLEEEG